jgi:hypothetical protein
VKIVVPVEAVGGWGCVPVAPNLWGAICPPNYNNLNIIVSCGKSLASG